MIEVSAATVVDDRGRVRRNFAGNFASKGRASSILERAQSYAVDMLTGPRGAFPRRGRNSCDFDDYVVETYGPDGRFLESLTVNKDREWTSSGTQAG